MSSARMEKVHLGNEQMEEHVRALLCFLEVFFRFLLRDILHPRNTEDMQFHSRAAVASARPSSASVSSPSTASRAIRPASAGGLSLIVLTSLAYELHFLLAQPSDHRMFLCDLSFFL